MRPTLWSEERARAYRRARHWTADTFVAALERNAKLAPDATAFADERRLLTWAAARAWIETVACGLARAGLGRDTVLATWLPNSIEHYLARFACELAGLLWLPIPYAAGASEARSMLEAAGPAGLIFAATARHDVARELGSLPAFAADIAWLDALARVRPSPEEAAELRVRAVRPGELAMLVPTSGSTGAPKLCEYALDGAVARGRAQTELFHLTSSDAIVAAVQGFGPSITPLLAAPVAGAAVIVLERPEPAALLDAIARHRATVVCAVPPVYRDLLPRLDDRARSVRIWYSTGMAMPKALAQELEARTRGVVVSGYGGVDLGCWTASAPEDPPAVRHGTVGRARGGTELRLVSDDGAEGEGEVWGRGPSSTWGYFGDAAATRSAWTADGWFRTGDVGRLDDEGNLVLVGRKVEVINRGGHKVYPEEIERLLEEHERVARAAVVPYPDERLGERVCACVVAAPGARLTLDDIVTHLRARGLATYKLPERLELLESLPAAPGGKVARRQLAQLVASEAV